MAHANNTVYTTPADAGDGDPDCMGYRRISNEELADLPSNWENPPMDKNHIQIPIPNVGAGQWAAVEGAKGFLNDITAIRVTQRETSAGDVVDIQAVGKRGFVIRGGFWHIPEHIMDQLCQEWLKRKETE